MSDHSIQAAPTGTANDTYVLPRFSITELNAVYILRHSAAPADTTTKGYLDLPAEQAGIHFVAFSGTGGMLSTAPVSIRQDGEQLVFSCRCGQEHTKLCSHQVRAFFNLMARKEIRVFFDEPLREQELRNFAGSYGLEGENRLLDFFSLELKDQKMEIRPLIQDLIPVTPEHNLQVSKTLLPVPAPASARIHTTAKDLHQLLVLKEHRYYSHFQVGLMEAGLSAGGKIKNPLNALDPANLIWTSEHADTLKFYTAVAKFQQNYEPDTAETDIQALRALVKNPLQLPVFLHDPKVSPNLTASSLKPVRFGNDKLDLHLFISLKQHFYTVHGELLLNGKRYDLSVLNIRHKYFIHHNHVIHLLDNPHFFRAIHYFRQHNNHLVIHESRFALFQADILSHLEDRIMVNYAYLKAASPEQLAARGPEETREKIIYLAEADNFISFTPVMRYGTVEIPVFSRKQRYATDSLGNPFSVQRCQEEELSLLSALARQHPSFQDQLRDEAFYLHKSRLTEEDWFLQAFEAWQGQHITVLGFQTLKGNTLNPNRPKITIAVKSGLNWFDSQFEIRFGNQLVPLKDLHRAIRNKNKFIKLGDGTLGLLPEEWMARFQAYFNAGELSGESIRTPKVNYSSIAELYQEEVLSAEVRTELKRYRDKFAAFRQVQQVEVPAEFCGTLRDYQKEGLNWLNFLDEFGFGGCLADDMGLGKTPQIIAFILSQRNKGHHNTNLVVVPTTLIFNWQDEIRKFAPSIRVCTIHGSDRIRDTGSFANYEVILTAYGTLLHDVNWLKKYAFNYIFLDESQTIKNPESLRYRAVRLLQSRNKIVLTGTPLENNTFDLYGQLSFACPGLLGSKQFFRDHYSTPIDKFKDTRRARELKSKVSPFILRRTKAGVAAELPGKTEMLIYCEMGNAQQNAYDACKNEYRAFLNGEKEEDLPKHALHVLKGLTRLRQICNSPSLLGDDLLHGTASSKITTLMEEIGNHSAAHKILVFSQFTGMLDLIGKELEKTNIAFEYLSGQTRNRAERVGNFQENAQIRVFLISLKAGGTGLNLTAADYVYIVDPWWNPAAENQAIDRIYRIGQQKNVVAVRLICPDTIEEKIMKLQETKRQLSDELIGTGSSLFKSLTKADLLALFS